MMYFVIFIILTKDWIMKTTTNFNRNGNQWTLTEQLRDLDWVADTVMLSSTRNQLQDKLNILYCRSQRLGLKQIIGKRQK